MDALPVGIDDIIPDSGETISASYFDTVSAQIY